MHTSVLRLVTAALALLFILGACASSSGAAWTYAPVVATADESPTGTSAPGGSPAADGTTAPADGTTCS